MNMAIKHFVLHLTSELLANKINSKSFKANSCHEQFTSPLSRIKRKSTIILSTGQTFSIRRARINKRYLRQLKVPLLCLKAGNVTADMQCNYFQQINKEYFIN